MKKPTVKKATSSHSELELRRWCVEQATRWPMEGNGYGIASGGGGYRTETDVIGRANRLLAWVKAQ